MCNSDKNKYFDSKLYNISYGIEKVEEVIDNLKNGKTELSNINSIMELYNVHSVLIDKTYLDSAELQKCRESCSEISDAFNEYFKNLTYKKICDDLNNIDIAYHIDYIELLITRKIYKKVDKMNAPQFLRLLNCHPSVYLKRKSFVEYFNNEIKNQIMASNLFAEVFIDKKYYVKEIEKIFLPQLTNDEIRKALSRYVKDKQANPHYLDKILKIREFNNDELLQVQCEASYKKDKLFESIFKNQNGQGISIQLRVEDELSNSCKYTSDKIVLTYNKTELESNLDYPSILNNFIYLFEFVNCHTMLCNLVYKPSNDGIIELISDGKGRDVYVKNYSFEIQNALSHIQVAFYLEFLYRNNININDLIRWFFNQYIRDEFGIEGFEVSISDNNNSYHEKCKDLVTIFDEIKKQYYIWVKFNSLDKKLVEMHTKPIKFAEIPSKNLEHYYYNESDDINNEIKMLFDNQSRLFYIEKTKSKYNSLCNLLLNEKVTLDDFYPHQINSIKWLINRGTLQLVDGYIKINFSKVMLLMLLYEDNVIVLTMFDKTKILEVLKDERHKIENALLTKQEAEYFDYFLNDIYTNGEHIRNKYVHPPTTKDENVCKQDYYIIIRLIMILIIKINDDLCTYFKTNN